MPFDPKKLEEARTPSAGFDPSLLESARAELGEAPVELQPPKKPHYQQRPDVTFTGSLKSGFERMITPAKIGGVTLPAPHNVLLGAAEVLSAPVAPLTNLVSRGAKAVSEPFEGLPEPQPFTQHLPIPGGGISRTITPEHTAKEIGQAAEFAGDIGGSLGLMGLLKRTRTGLTRLLPTNKEKVAVLNQRLSDVTRQAEQSAQTQLGAAQTEQQARLAALEKQAIEAQQATVAGQARREAVIPGQRAGVIRQAQSDIGDIQTRLAQQQARVGEGAARAGAPTGPARENFARRYEKLKTEGRNITTTPVNLNTSARGISRESGFGAMDPAERNALHMNKILTQADPLEIEEEIGSQIRRMIDQGGAVKKVDYNAIVKSVLGPATSDSVTVEQLIHTQKRLNAAQSAAYQAGHKNLARQFGVMEEAVENDIKAASRKVAAQLKAVDRDYFKKKSVDWYTDGVQNAFDPKTGAWDRKRFTKWWEDHADELNENKYLKRMLGDKYESTQALVKEMQQATESNIEKAARTAITNRRRTAKDELAGLAQREKDLGKLSKVQGEQIGAAQKEGEAAIRKEFAGKEKDIIAARDAEVKRLKAEIDEKVMEITGKPYSDSTGRWVGPLLILHGVTTANIATIGTGILTVMTHDKLIQAMNTVRGQSLLRRLVRAAPGSGEAIAAGNALARVVKSDERESLEGAQQENLTTAQPDKLGVPPPLEIKSSGKVNSLLKKYGVEP
jgi:hypothetical protein